MNIQHDGKGQLFVEWTQAPSGFKRAWVRHADPQSDWAGTQRYINVARTESIGGGPAGQSADFPIFVKTLTDEQALVAFVTAVCGVTGCPIP